MSLEQLVINKTKRAVQCTRFPPMREPGGEGGGGEGGGGGVFWWLGFVKFMKPYPASGEVVSIVSIHELQVATEKLPVVPSAKVIKIEV